MIRIIHSQQVLSQELTIRKFNRTRSSSFWDLISSTHRYTYTYKFNRSHNLVGGKKNARINAGAILLRHM